ncbi:hypothetical protein LTR70_000881 [Exophiala xenobiotica]|nr:hypothetical protein LTR70_000881 [Exophiala xenobiotica]
MTAGESNKGIVLFQYISHLHDCERRVAALLAQALQYRRRLSPAVRDRYAHHRPLNSRPTTAGLIDLLITELAEYEDVYIVIDALDAARDQVRAQFVKSLCSICSKRQGVRLLFASHDKQILGRDVTDVQCFEVVAKLSDLETFIQTQMKDKVAISNVTEDDPKLIEEIMRILINRAHGLFLLAYQHLEQIDAANIETVADLRTFANDLSTTIDKVYTDSLKQIQTQACSGRDLPLELMRHALAFERYPDMVLSNDHFGKDRSILSPCKGLVRIGEASRRIGFFHPSASGFFQNHIEDLGIKHPHLLLSKICLVQFRYLDHIFDPRSNTTAKMLEQKLARFPLLGYALDKFSYHARKAPELSLSDDFNRTFAVEQRRSCVAALYLWKYLPEQYSRRIRRYQVSHIHLLAAMDLPVLLDRIVEAGATVDAEDELGWTPLQWSVLTQNQNMMKHLVSRQASLAHRDKQGTTALLWALAERDPRQHEMSHSEKKGWRLKAGGASLVVAGRRLVTEGESLITEGNDLLARSSPPDRGAHNIGAGKGDRRSGADLVNQGRDRIQEGNRLIAAGEHLNEEGTKLVAQAGDAGHSLSVRAGAWVQVSQVIDLTPYSTQAPDLWMYTTPPLTNLETLELLVDLHQTRYSLADQASLMRLAAQKRLGTIVNKLLDKGLRPAFLIDALLGSCNYSSISNILIQDEAEAVVGYHIRIRETSKSIILDERWICRLITPETMHSVGPRGRSPLSLAAEMGFVSVCRELIARGARVDDIDADGWTPLMWAVVRPKSHKLSLDNCVVQDRGAALLGVAIEIEGSFSTDDNAYAGQSWDSRATEKVRIVELLLQRSAACRARDLDDASVLVKARWDRVPGVLDVLRQHMVRCGHSYRGESTGPPSWDEDEGELFPILGDVSLAASIHVRNALVRDRSRVLFNGKGRTNMVATEEAHIMLGCRHWLPHVPLHVYRAILSLIQLRIINVVVKDSATVMFGLLAMEVETLTETDGRPRPFLLSGNGAKLSLYKMFQEMYRYAHHAPTTAEDYPNQLGRLGDSKWIVKLDRVLKELDPTRLLLAKLSTTPPPALTIYCLRERCRLVCTPIVPDAEIALSFPFAKRGPAAAAAPCRSGTTPTRSFRALTFHAPGPRAPPAHLLDLPAICIRTSCLPA